MWWERFLVEVKLENEREETVRKAGMARVENVCAFAEKAPLRLVGKCISDWIWCDGPKKKRKSSYGHTIQRIASKAVVVTQSKASQVTNVPLYSMPRYRKVEEQLNEFLLAPTVEPVKT